MKYSLWSFYKSLLRNPRQMGSAIPSSKYLAKAMASFVPNNIDHLIIELGPGTGVITRALIEQHYKPNNIVAIERSKEMAKKLSILFPEITVLHGDATDLKKLIEKFDTPICAIVSSLPLLSLPTTTKLAILKQIESLLDKKGRFIQFTYGPHDPVSRHFKKLKFIQSKKIWRNIPPARIYIYEMS